MEYTAYICDTETTGLKKATPPASGIVQVAALKLNLQFDIVEEINLLIAPGCPIEPGAMAVHGVTEEMVAGKPSLQEAFRIEEPMFFIAHNCKFDYPRLAACLDNCVQTLCTLEAARRYLKGQPNNKLLTLVRHFGLEEFPAHDALGDTKMTHGLLRFLLQTTGLSLLEMAEQLTVPKIPTEINFGRHAGKPLRELPDSYVSWLLGLKDLNDGLRRGLEMERKVRGYN